MPRVTSKTAIETGRDVSLGAIGGGLAGAVIGRSSFLVGIAVTGVDTIWEAMGRHHSA